jgi:hypothetical protein
VPVPRAVFLEVRAEAKVEVAMAAVVMAAAVATEGAVMVAEAVVMVEVAMAAAPEDLEEVAGLVAAEGPAAALVLEVLVAVDLAVALVPVAPEEEAVPVVAVLVAPAVEEAQGEVVEADLLLYGKRYRWLQHNRPCWFLFYNKEEDAVPFRTRADKPVVDRGAAEEGRATWDRVVKAADAVLAVTVVDVDPAVMVADVDPTVADLDLVEIVVDATAGDAETVAVRLEWVEVACQHLVKVVAGNQKLRNGTPVCLTP